MVKTVTHCKKPFFFFIKVLKAREKKLALNSLFYVDQEIWLGNSKKLF